MEPKSMAVLRIYQILMDYSDEYHPLLQEEIVSKLKNLYGIDVERKAVGRALQNLSEAGLVCTEKRGKGTFIAEKPFSDTEIYLLIDAVLGSKYIPIGTSKSIIDGLCSLTNKYFRKNVEHIQAIKDLDKSKNIFFYDNIALVNEAIENKKQISYDFYKYDKEGKLYKSSEWVVTPYQLIIHNQRYYLMSYSEKLGKVLYQKVDRMKDMTVIDAPAMDIRKVEGFSEGINFNNISTSMPYMFSDKPERVRMLISEKACDQVVDWFGSNVKFLGEEPDGTGRIIVEIPNVSKQAMKYWALQFMDEVEVVSPPDLRENIIEEISKGLELYKAQSTKQ